MRAMLFHCLLATACAAGLAACGDDDDDDDGEVSNGGKGGDHAGGTGGTGGGESGTGGGGGASAIAMCVDGSSADCPTAEGQPDGVPCCTVMTDIMPYYTATGLDHCGLKFPDRVPCFELDGPGVEDDECPQNLDAGDGQGGLSMWGRHPGCCHPLFGVCGILQPDTGCTLYRPSAVKEDGSTIGGMGSGDWMCTP